MPRVQLLESTPSTSTGLKFRLKPHTQSDAKISLTNVSSGYVAYKIKINHKTRYRVNPTQGTLKPNESVSIAIKIDKIMVNEVLQQSFDTSKPVTCEDKFLVLSIPVPQQGIAHLADQSEKDRLKTLAALFSNPHVKKKQSKLKFDENRFESAYWSQQLDADAVRRREGSTSGEPADAEESLENAGSASSSNGESTITASGDSNNLGIGEKEALPDVSNSMPGTQTIGDQGRPDSKDGAVTQDVAGESKKGRTDAAVALSDTSNSPAVGSSVEAGPASSPNAVRGDNATASAIGESLDLGTAAAPLPEASSNGNSGSVSSSSEAKTASKGPAESKLEGGYSSLGADESAGARKGGGIMKNITRAEHERLIQDMILIRNKYNSLLKTAIKHTAERDKFEELLHKARAETNKYREIAKSVRADIDLNSSAADVARVEQDAAAVAAVAAAQQSAGSKKSGVPLFVVVLLMIVAMVLGRLSLSWGIGGLGGAGQEGAAADASSESATSL